MLIGFFKSVGEIECNARIIAFTDRIWLREQEDGFIRRSFTVEIEQSSPKHLSEISMLLPCEVLDLQAENQTAFDPNWYYNSPGIRTTSRSQSKYAISKIPASDIHFGTISDDGLDNIRVYVNDAAAPRFFRVKNCTVIKFKLSPPLENGQRAQWRISFYAPSLSKNITPQNPLKTLACEIKYFVGDSYIDEVDTFGERTCIPITHHPGGDRSGGFSILLYAPPNFALADGFSLAVTKTDSRDENGNIGDQRTKLVWQLRRILQESGEMSPTIGCNTHTILSGTFAQRDSGSVIGKLQATIQDFPERLEPVERDIQRQNNEIAQHSQTVGKQTREVRLATYVAIVALALSLLGLIPLFVDELAKHAHSGGGLQLKAPATSHQ